MTLLSKFLLHFIVLPIIIMVLILMSDGYFLGLEYKLSKNITQKNIKKLELNMPESEVIKILGEPIRKSIEAFYDSDYIFEYSKTYLAGIYVEFGFINKKLIFWRIEDSNDITIYSCDKKKCPYINQCVYDKVIPVE